ncbi:hypothetical protein HYPSUDRAFT_150030, partial [Hypholoma sublateritium FD-334 SS-4]
WCSSCRNGGTLNVCQTCFERAFCEECTDINSPTAQAFICPTCHNWSADNHKAYPFKLMQSIATREIYLKVLLDPLAIISINQQGMPTYGSPAPSVYHSLVPWFHGNLALIELDFNFLNKKSVENFERRLDLVLNELLGGELVRFRRFCVFVMSHSVPKNGDLHIGPQHKGAAPIKDMWDIFFPPKFCTLLEESSNSNLLSIMSCGSVSTVMDSRRAIQEFADKQYFNNIYTFTQANFQPSLSFAFFHRLVLDTFVYDRKAVKYVLQDCQGLGSHTGIMEFTTLRITGPTQFTWTHPGAAPAGKAINMQCIKCKRIGTMKRVKDNSPSNREILHACSTYHCDTEIMYTIPAGVNWVLGKAPVDGDSSGAWFVQYNVPV